MDVNIGLDFHSSLLLSLPPSFLACPQPLALSAQAGWSSGTRADSHAYTHHETLLAPGELCLRFYFYPFVD